MFAVLHIADFALHAVLRIESLQRMMAPALHSKKKNTHGGAVPSPRGSAAERTPAAHPSDLPAALFAGTGKKSLILAANPAARAAGVEIGMSAPQAVARCATLLIRSPLAAAETEARAALLAVGFSLSPSIEDTAPGVCTVDLKGFDSGEISARVHAAVAELDQLGLPATAGIASTPLLALYAARATPPPQVEACLQAIRKPRGRPSPASRLLPADRVATPVCFVTDATPFLAPLPLAVADPSPALAEIFRGWGLRTLGDLTALPRDDIVRRFGAEGLALWQRAAGGATRPLYPVAPPRKFFATMEFEDAIETLEPLLFILRRLVDRLTLELRAAQLVAAELALTLRLEDETRHTHPFRLPEPTADSEIIFRALHTHLESLRTAACITALELHVTPARPLVRQQGLFESGLRDPHGFAETLARVAALVGADRVGTPQLENTHRIDAVKLVPPAAVIPAPADPAVHPPLSLPLRRFRPPLPARLEFTEGRPSYLWTEMVRGEISAQTHEWPSDGDWWQNDRAWSRSEWDIALAGGGLYRLLLVGDAYFLEGEYD